MYQKNFTINTVLSQKLFQLYSIPAILFMWPILVLNSWYFFLQCTPRMCERERGSERRWEGALKHHHWLGSSLNTIFSSDLMSHAEKLFPFMTTVRFVRYFVIGACGSRTCDLQLTDRRLNNVLYSPFPYSLLYLYKTS